MTTTVNTGRHNGIASYSMTGEGICTGTLMFGVGFRNEPATLAGITHLVEHLVLRRVEPVTLLHGGNVDVDTVEFWATGDRKDVAVFLNSIAAAICNFGAVTEEDVVLEKSVLEAEDPSAFTRASSGLLAYRFGMRGLGVGQFGAPTITGLSRAEAIDWVHQWFTAENAAVTFTADLPGELVLHLPHGIVVTRGPDVAEIEKPTLVKVAKTGVALSLMVPFGSTSFLGSALEYELLARLRHACGLIYSVTIFTTTIDADHDQLDLILDPVHKNVPAAFKESVAAVQDVAANGFSDEAIRYSHYGVRVALEGEDAARSGYMDRLAIDQLLGRTTLTPQEWLEQAAAITPSDLTAVLASSMASLVVAVDRDATVRKSDVEPFNMALDPFDIWQRPAKGRREPERGQPAWRHKQSKAVLWLTPKHLLKRESGKTRSIALADIAVVGNRSCGCIALLDRRGRTAELPMDDWKRGKKLRAALLSAFPAEVIRAFPEE